HFCLLFLLYLESFLLCTFSLHVALPILDLPAVAAQCKESVGRLEWSGRCRIARNPSSSLRCSSNGFSLACSLLSRRLLAASISGLASNRSHGVCGLSWRRFTFAPSRLFFCSFADGRKKLCSGSQHSR